MPFSPEVIAEVAARYGHVDPCDSAAVGRFFDETLATLDLVTRKRILFEVAVRRSGGADRRTGGRCR